MKSVRCLLVIGCFCWSLIVWASPAITPFAVNLEPAQQQWLEQHRSLRVGLVLQAPFAQFDRRLQQLYGVNVELMNWLGRSLGLDLTWLTSLIRLLLNGRWWLVRSIWLQV